MRHVCPFFGFPLVVRGSSLAVCDGAGARQCQSCPYHSQQPAQVTALVVAPGQQVRHTPSTANPVAYA